MEIYKKQIHKDSEAGIGIGFDTTTSLNQKRYKTGITAWFGRYFISIDFRDRSNGKIFRCGNYFATGVGG